MEKLSARDLDASPDSETPTPRAEGAEHLKSLRDVLTPFIASYIETFNAPDQAEDSEYVLRYMANRPALVPNYEKLVEACALSEADPYLFKYLAFSPDQAYKEYSAHADEYPTPEGQSQFEERLRVLRQAVHSADFDSIIDSLNAESRLGFEHSTDFARVVSFAVENAEHFTEAGLRYMPGPRWYSGLPMKNCDSVLWGIPQTGHPSKRRPFPPVLTIPVGEYGEALAERIFNTTQHMLQNTVRMGADAKKIADAHADLFSKTARGQEQSVQMDQAILKTLQEGVVTLGQSIALLTVEKVGDIEQGEVLLEKIIEAELPNDLAYKIPGGFIGPTSLLGKHVPHMVVEEGARGLKINPEYVALMQEEKDQITRMRKADRKFILPAAGRGCPVSFKGKKIEVTGINSLSQVFLSLSKEEEVRAPDS